ncbi:MAG: hypothetical protein ACE5ID_02950 [Acidobacteriota bacterium]
MLALKDDDSREVVFRKFSFPFQGRAWSSVFVNSNGTLTFGEPDLFPFPRLPSFLDGPPRLAVLWNDHDPAAGGLVTVERSDTSLTIHFTQVPRFMSLATSTFQVTLGADGSILYTYGPTSVRDALVGLTAGQGATDPGPVDLTAALSLSAEVTAYESFQGNTFDLAGQTLVWTPASPAPVLSLHPRLKGSDHSETRCTSANPSRRSEPGGRVARRQPPKAARRPDGASRSAKPLSPEGRAPSSRRR